MGNVGRRLDQCPLEIIALELKLAYQLADKHRLKASLLDNQRGEHIVSPEAADDAGLL
jgi:hypothetical protein